MIALLLAAALASDPVDRLRAELDSHASATAVLQAVCDRRGPPGSRIRARQAIAVDDPGQATRMRRDLRIGAGEPVRHRRVELLCGDAVFSRADNWYLPDRLTPQMNATLETTETPFGVVVGPLKFRRRTLATERLPGPDEVLRNRATLATPDGRPFSLVVETYTAEALR